jgi:hypothetical protein
MTNYIKNFQKAFLFWVVGLCGRGRRKQIKRKRGAIAPLTSVSYKIFYRNKDI